MEWLQIIVLGLIQGITEFLPISSSAHLILPTLLTDWPDQGLAFDVGVHFGSLLAVVIYFRRDLAEMASACLAYPIDRVYNPQVDIVLKLAVATLPLAIIGFVAKDFVQLNLRTLPVIASTTVGFAILLWWSDRNLSNSDKVDWSHALVIGLAQILALMPGTSRSGITITAALFMGLSRTAGARFSFLLSIPAICGAQLLLTLDLVAADIARWEELIAGALISGVSAYLCIHFFISLVERTGMLPYVYYRLMLGTLLAGFIVYA